MTTTALSINEIIAKIGMNDHWVSTADSFKKDWRANVTAGLPVALMYDSWQTLAWNSKGFTRKEVVFNWRGEQDSPKTRWGHPIAPVEVNEGYALFRYEETV